MGGALMSKLYKMMTVFHMTTHGCHALPAPFTPDKMQELKVLSQDYNRAQK